MQELRSQTPEDMQALGKFQELLDESSVSSQAGDYALALSYMDDALSLYGSTSEWFKKSAGNAVLGSTYYNIACYNSLAGNLTEAISAFQRAVVDHGWNDYNHTMTDPDLDNIRDMDGFAELMETLRERGDFAWILSTSGEYVPHTGEQDLPPFTYQDAGDPDLVKVRDYFDLDSIAGDGDEISRILNLLHWVHNAVRHDGSSFNPESKNAIDLVEICRREGRGVNCRMMAQILNECYLAMGFKSRFVTCMPKVFIDDCHVINTVYSETLGKWLWVDPTFEAWVTDENGTMLGIGEVRERLRSGAPLVLNENANWNNESPQNKEHYLDYYMTKNLYYVVCPLHSVSDAETFGKREPAVYVALIPEGYPAEEEYGSNEVRTSDDKYFWQRPDVTK